MAVILLILKIIGIILLLLLGIILLALALVLLVPVRYRISGKVDEDVSVRIAVTWLLHLVSFRSVYEEGELTSVLRILGIRRKDRKASSEPEDESDDEQTDEDEILDEAEIPGEAQHMPKELPEHPQETEAQHTETGSASAARTAEERRSEAKEPPGHPQETEQHTETGSASAARTAEEQRSEAQKPLEHPKESWIARMRARIQGVFQSIRAKIEGLKGAASRIKETLCNIKGFLSDENNKIVFPAIWTEVKYLLCHFKFRRIKTDLAFSLGDPALTGQVLGALSVLPFLYQYEIQIAPDFVSEEVYIKGSFDIKGYARGIHVLKSVIRLIRKKEFRIWLKKLLDR
ncbi:MAG: hypothetical protein J6K53_06475 [Roseburia sp.]|nr:hypothetical protein [Roseburia sp.]